MVGIALQLNIVAITVVGILVEKTVLCAIESRALIRALGIFLITHVDRVFRVSITRFGQLQRGVRIQLLAPIEVCGQPFWTSMIMAKRTFRWLVGRSVGITFIVLFFV